MSSHPVPADRAPARRADETIPPRAGAPSLRATWPVRGRQAAQLLGGYVSITAVFVLLGRALVGPLDGSWVVRTDRAVERWFAAHRTPLATTLSFWGSQLGETTTKVVVTLVVCALLVRRYGRWFEAALVAVPLVLEAAAFLTTTLIVKRPRPDVARLDGSPVNSSFPSGHTAAATCYVAIALVVHRHAVRRWLAWLAGAIVGLVTVAVGLARMYRGMHHPTDVVGGALLGIVSVVVAVWILNRAPQAAALERGSATHPSAGGS